MSEFEMLIVAATEREASPFRERGSAVVVSGVGKVNAAIVSSLAIAGRPDSTVLISVGVAGSLPGPDAPTIGDLVIGAVSVSAEDGMATPEGFVPIDEMGFPLARGARSGRFPADPDVLKWVRALMPDVRCGSIATVSTCSGTDEAAQQVVDRTGAIAEAMEGVGVLQAACQLGVPAIEIRAISNTTGRRDAQVWDLEAGCEALSALADALARA